MLGTDLSTFDSAAPPARVYDFDAVDRSHYVMRQYGDPRSWPQGRPAPTRPTPYYGFGPASDGQPLAGPRMVYAVGNRPMPRLWNGVAGLGEDPPRTWGEKHPLQKTFAENSIELAKEQPWLTALGIFLGGAVLLKTLGVMGSLGSH